MPRSLAGPARAMRLIGAGRPGFGDDAAGVEVVRRVRGIAPDPVELVECAGDAASVVEAMRGADVAWIVDAMRSGAPPGTVRRFDVSRGPLPAAPERGSSHGLGVAEGIELARALGVLPREVVVWGIEGAVFDAGAPITPEVAEAVRRLALELGRAAGRPR